MALDAHPASDRRRVDDAKAALRAAVDDALGSSNGNGRRGAQDCLKNPWCMFGFAAGLGVLITRFPGVARKAAPILLRGAIALVPTFLSSLRRDGDSM